MIAFHFPPLVGTSGIQRTLRFVQHLPAFGWRPVVLTVRPGIYESIDVATESQIPEDCRVVRTACLDTARYVEAEAAYMELLARTPADDEAYQGVVDNLAAAIYKQGEEATVAGDDRAAAAHFLRVRAEQMHDRNREEEADQQQCAESSNRP